MLEEDGRPQVIRFFSRESDLPLTLGLLVETGMSQRRVLEQERSSSGHFIDQLLREDKDKAFLIHFDREVELLQDLTPSKQKLNAALDLLQQPQLKHSKDDSPGEKRISQRRTQIGPWASGRHVVRLGLSCRKRTDAEAAGRKAVIVISSGVDQASKVTLERAIESAQRADMVVYAIYLAGKQSSDGGGWERGAGAAWAVVRGAAHGTAWRRLSPRREPAEHPDGKPILERISRETGGRMFEVSKKRPSIRLIRRFRKNFAMSTASPMCRPPRRRLGVPQDPCEHDPEGTCGASQRGILPVQVARCE